MNKLVKSIREAILLSGLKDGMTVSFHHHLRNGDHVLNMVMEQIAELGIKNITVTSNKHTKTLTGNFDVNILFKCFAVF